MFIPILSNGSGDVKVKFMEAFIQSVGTLQFTFAPVSDSAVARARNIAAWAFLKSDREYLFFWDADIVATKQDIERLCENDCDILCGIYCKKQVSLNPEPVFNTLEGKGVQICGGLEEIKRGGTGFMRIHRSVFEKIKAPESAEILKSMNVMKLEYHNHGETQWNFFPMGVLRGEYLSEDWYFCDIARELGFKVMLDTRIQTLHDGSCLYPIDWKALGLVPAPADDTVTV